MELMLLLGQGFSWETALQQGGFAIVAFAFLQVLIELWRRYTKSEDKRSTELAKTNERLVSDLIESQKTHSRALSQQLEKTRQDVSESNEEAYRRLVELQKAYDVRTSELEAEIKRISEQRVEEAMRIVRAAQAMDESYTILGQALRVLADATRTLDAVTKSEDVQESR